MSFISWAAFKLAKSILPTSEHSKKPRTAACCRCSGSSSLSSVSEYIAKRYRVSEHDHSLNFPPRRDDLLGTLLARALQMLSPDQAETLAEEVGFDYGRSLASRMAPSEGQRSVKAALATVADALTAHGFAAHAESRGKVLTIVNDHCPYCDFLPHCARFWRKEARKHGVEPPDIAKGV